MDAYQDGALLPGFCFGVPVTITIDCDESVLDGLDESTLMLGYWNESTSDWLDAASTYTPTSAYGRHPHDDRLAVPICHLSQFAVLGDCKIYLPSVPHNS